MALVQKIAKEDVKLAETVFGQPFNEALVHQVVTAQMAGARAGTKAQKSRADVRGGGRKPWRQKGTGRARAGTNSSPIWRSGGTTFAARPRDFSKKVNRKMYRAAMRSILSELARLDRLVVVDNVKLEKPKTRELVDALTNLKIESVLIVLGDQNSNVVLAARNIPNVEVTDVAHLDPVQLIAYENVLVTVDASKQIEEKLQ